ncbi:MAG: hypothetical protein IIA44_13390 [Acidobacteria bacterium]|nr:hypothetical protein [Acidobacteriota bacterium]
MPIVFITGDDTLEGREKGFALGATSFLTKPCPKGELLAVVKKILLPSPVFEGTQALVVDDSAVVPPLVGGALRRQGELPKGSNLPQLLERHNAAANRLLG